MNQFFAWMLLACALASPAAAQAPAGPPPQPLPDTTTRIVLDVTRVNILFTVSDKRGRLRSCP